MKIVKDIKFQSKWYLGAALICVVVLGSILGRQQKAIPNQEIVLQFVDEDISLLEANRTISIVEQELYGIGITEIRVSEQQDGRLVISYFSDSNIESIKKLLATHKELAQGLVNLPEGNNPLKHPSNETPIGYNLDVFEIQDGQKSFSSLGGKWAVESKLSQQRFLNPNLYISVEELVVDNSEKILKVNLNFNKYIAITKDYRSHKIPEVRAGPIFIWG